MTLAANIGTAERLARLGLGLALIVLALAGTLGASAYLGIVPLATAFVRFCPACALLGLRTCRDR